MLQGKALDRPKIQGPGSRKENWKREKIDNASEVTVGSSGAIHEQRTGNYLATTAFR